jgi:hypothetical protein
VVVLVVRRRCASPCTSSAVPAMSHMAVDQCGQSANRGIQHDALDVAMANWYLLHTALSHRPRVRPRSRSLPTSLVTIRSTCDSKNTVACLKDFLGKDFRSVEPTDWSVHLVNPENTVFFRIKTDQQNTRTVHEITTRHLPRLASSATGYAQRPRIPLGTTCSFN